MSRPVLQVELDRYRSTVSGYRSRELVEQIAGRPPMWLSLRRAWSTSEETARAVVVLAERAGYDVVIVGPRTNRQRALQALIDAPEPREVSDVAERGLW